VAAESAILTSKACDKAFDLNTGVYRNEYFGSALQNLTYRILYGNG